MDRLAWSDGSKPIRSMRNDKMNVLSETNIPDSFVAVAEKENSATDIIIGTEISNAATSAESSLQLFKSMPHADHTAMFRPCGYREEVYTRISAREPIEQVSQNPFFGKTNYIHHLNDEHDFLRPKNKYNEFK